MGHGRDRHLEVVSSWEATYETVRCRTVCVCEGLWGVLISDHQRRLNKECVWHLRDSTDRDIVFLSRLHTQATSRTPSWSMHRFRRYLQKRKRLTPEIIRSIKVSRWDRLVLIVVGCTSNLLWTDEDYTRRSRMGPRPSRYRSRRAVSRRSVVH